MYFKWEISDSSEFCDNYLIRQCIRDSLFIPTEHDTGVSLPLLIQEKAENSKNRKMEKS